ncbi:MAG: hypothetical protein Q7S82_03775, partial [bacterium]|nr:hypothetical protein [bacterium]
RKSYGDPVVELNNEKDGAEKWIYKPESSSYSEGAKIYLTFSSHGTLEEAKMVNNPGPKRP